MDDAVKRVEAFCYAWMDSLFNGDSIYGYDGHYLTVSDLRAIIEENKRLREALEYCAETGDSGRWDGSPEDCPANDHVMMWYTAKEALEYKP